MNRYPRWKYTLIAAVILLAGIYALPNYFAPVPAIQISPASGGATTGLALQKQVEDALEGQRIHSLRMVSDSIGIRISFADQGDQLKALDTVRNAVGANYSVALNLVPSSPDWLDDLGALPMHLGLDLRGGVHFLMQVDMAAALHSQLDRRIGDVRLSLRDAKVPLAGVARDGSRLIVMFRDADTKSVGSQILRRSMRDFIVTSLDETRLSMEPVPDSLKKLQAAALQQNLLTLRNRINQLGVSEPIIQQQGEDRIVVELPGIQDSARAKDILGRTASLEIHLVEHENGDSAHLDAALRGSIPPGDALFNSSRDARPMLVKKRVELTGEDISTAAPGFSAKTNEPSVDITFNIAGARKFSDLTRDNIHRQMAFILIEKGRGELVTAPFIEEPIPGGKTQIVGHMTVKEASDISLLLRSGALAAPMEIVEERTIGPSLGADNIHRGVHSILWGFVAVAVFVCLYYLAMGLFSTVALAVNVLLLVAILSFIQATLTLPGIAAIALTVGMAIDSNVLINERIREELRNGQTAQGAIRAGYDRAFATILDSNITNLIAGVALYCFGSGPVRGFAVVLCLGILTSMFSAILVSRALVNLVYGRRRHLKKISI